ncbi:MAG: hypothetical protein Q9207_002025 [Kuettlingeria erythrocarpa]
MELKAGKCDATDNTSCSECTSRNTKCQFTKDSNKRMSSIKQVQDLEKQLAQAKQQLNQLRSQSGDRSPDESQSYPRSGLPSQEYEGRPRKRQKISAARDFSTVRSDLRNYGRGIFKPPQSYLQQDSHAAPRLLAARGVALPVLPPKHVADELLYFYRISFQATFPLLDWSSFEKEYEAVYRRRSLREVPQVWSALLFAVFACGTLPQSLRDGQDYSEASTKLFDLSTDDLTVDHVRAAILTSVFLVESNHKSAGWTWLGVAARIGQDIGLHVPDVKGPFLYQVTNRPVWWTVYVCDRLLSLELGRPCMINDNDCEMDVPSPDKMEVQRADSARSYSTPTHSPLVPTVPVIRGISKLLQTIKDPITSPAAIQSFDTLFDECMDLFPAHHQINAFGPLDPYEISPVVYLQNARLMLHRHNLTIKNSPNGRAQALNKCIDIAKQTTRYLARCMPNVSREEIQPRGGEDRWQGPMRSAASAFLCTHIWRCSLLLSFRAEYADASVCAQASAAIGAARPVNLACGRYLDFFLHRLLAKLQEEAEFLETDEELLALVSGDLQGSADNAWVWKDAEGDRDQGSSRHYSPNNPSPATAHDDNYHTWSDWDAILDTLQRLLQDKRRQQQRQPYTQSELRVPLKLPSQFQQQTVHLASPVSPGGSETPQNGTSGRIRIADIM